MLYTDEQIITYEEKLKFSDDLIAMHEERVVLLETAIKESQDKLKINEWKIDLAKTKKALINEKEFRQRYNSQIDSFEKQKERDLEDLKNFKRIVEVAEKIVDKMESQDRGLTKGIIVGFKGGIFKTDEVKITKYKQLRHLLDPYMRFMAAQQQAQQAKKPPLIVP